MEHQILTWLTWSWSTDEKDSTWWACAGCVEPYIASTQFERRLIVMGHTNLIADLTKDTGLNTGTQERREEAITEGSVGGKARNPFVAFAGCDRETGKLDNQAEAWLQCLRSRRPRW